MEIKIITPRFAEAYYRLRLEALQDSPDSFSTLYEDALNHPIEKTRTQLATAHSITFGVFDNEKLIGNMTLVHNQTPKMNHKASIVAVYVSPDFRRMGVAAKLMDKLMEHALHLEGLEQLQLMVASSNLRAKKFYQRFGFTVYGIEVNAMKTGNRYIDEELMVKFL